MTEFAPGVHRIEAPLGDRFVALFLFVGSRGALLVDTGLDESVEGSVMPYLREFQIEPSSIRYIVSTHCDFDHIGGNQAAARNLPNASFISHALDQVMVDDLEKLISERYGEFIPDHGYDDVNADAKAFIRAVTATSRTDIAVVGGERIQLGDDWWVELIHTPGHSYGSLSVWDSRSGTLAIGDAVLSRGLLTVSGEPAFPPTYRYVDDYRDTIRRIIAMEPVWLGTAHYPLLSSEATRFLTDSLEYTHEVEEVVLHELSVVGADGATALEIIESGNSRLGTWPSPSALMYPIVGHLEQLEAEGRISRLGSASPSRWILT